MSDSMAWQAFWMGIISACSLPLGALTTRLWRPDDRATAVLMAFGGGALLAALTIDLVGSALASGQFQALAFGAVLGGLLFVAMNLLLNNFGAFLRKTSTTLDHLRRRELQRIRRIAGRLARTELLRDLAREDYRALAPSVRTLELAQGTLIHHAGDPAEALYIVAEGEILLESSETGRETGRASERIGPHETFGLLALFTGTPSSNTAIAATDVTLWTLPKAALDALLCNSPEFNQRVHRLLRSDPVPRYLIEHHGMHERAAAAWLNEAARSLLVCGQVPPALPIQRNSERLRERLGLLRRAPLLRGLPLDEQELLLDRVLYKRYGRGAHFFQRDEPASRLFIIDHGQVSLIEPRATPGASPGLGPNDCFGARALLTGARHSITAVAIEETRVWELRRSDLDELLRAAPSLAQRVRDFIMQGEAEAYLREQHGLSPERLDQWRRAALRALNAHQPLPSAAASAHVHAENAGAPLAIFLGITLDGIPESLVIGASMIQSPVSLSLLVGLFLSNYPEALSSSVGMRHQGLSFGRILGMWTALMLITGLGAALGSLFFVGAPPASLALIEGLAAGAMLTMIAQTMLPEAYFRGGSVVGLSTLFGFLIAIYAKTLEPADQGAHAAPVEMPIIEQPRL